MKVIYLNKKRYIKRIDKLFSFIDLNESGSISITEFFEIIDIVEKNPEF
jgi:hypothetical protein